MNNYKNPYNQFQYENSSRNPYYNQNNQPYFQTNSHNTHKRSKNQWSRKNQWSQNSPQNHWAANLGPQWGQNFNQPSSVQNNFSAGNEYHHYEDIQFEPQINCSNRGTIRNQDFGATQTKKFPKRVQSITKKQSFVPSLMEIEGTTECTSKTKDDVVKTPEGSFAEANKKNLNSRQINLLEAFSKPVESTKAERMMQVMGWKGGALGSRGQGLKEPLMPNIFQKKTTGFGVPEPKKERNVQKKINQPNILFRLDQKVENKPKKQASNPDILQPTNCRIEEFNPRMTKIITTGFKRKYIKMRKIALKPQKPSRNRQKRNRARKIGDDFKFQILNEILNFVNDDSRTSMVFDKDLTNHQRKTVHSLVASIRDNDDSDVNYDSLSILDLIHEIMEASNSCELFTESIGGFPNRQLHLYKSIPEHIYLVTEDDLRNDYVDDCIVIDDDEAEELTDKANNKPEDRDIEQNYSNEGENVKTDIFKVQTEQNTDSEKMHTEGANDKDEETMASNKTEGSTNTVKSDILNDVQRQLSISKDIEETSTQSAEVDIEENIKKSNEKTENRNTEPTGIESENKTDFLNGVQSQQSIGSDKLEKPTESIKRVLSNDITINQNINTLEQENNIKEIEDKDTTQNKEIDKIPKKQVRETLIEFFKEFFYNETYQEIRFSGDFNDRETHEIDKFMTEVKLCVGNVKNCQYVWNAEDNLQDIFQDQSYSLTVKVTPISDVLIQKVSKKKKKEEEDEDEYEFSD